MTHFLLLLLYDAALGTLAVMCLVTALASWLWVLHSR